MSNKRKINGWRKEEEKLLRKLNDYKKYKRKVTKTLGKLQNLHNNGIIDCDKYTEISHKYLDKKTPEKYIEELDNKIDDYNIKIKVLTNKINKHEDKVAIAPFIVLLMALILGTGMTVRIPIEVKLKKQLVVETPVTEVTEEKPSQISAGELPLTTLLFTLIIIVLIVVFYFIWKKEHEK